MYEDAEVRGTDRLMRVIYDRLAALHDPAVAVALPLCGSGFEETMRRRYLERLELEGLEGPVRILEVGVGTGANVVRIHEAMGRRWGRVEYWGLDLAEGMLQRCVRRLEKRGIEASLLLGDAHFLPFEDASFDRVFHIGATNNFSDPDRAMREMARVAKPGTPIVVVDERLDPNRRNTLYHRALYRLVTFYDWEPRDPVTMLPPEAIDVLDEQIARFFYCLTFRMP
jgi:ubiquinone/menaquinone biosynthesis C-methylase UbiE